jgi:hypothetical protein
VDRIAYRGAFKTIEELEIEVSKRGSIFSANFNQAKKLKYLIVRESRAGHSVANLWYSWCCLSNIPYVVAFTRKKYADIRIDLESTTIKFDNNTACKTIEDLVNRYKISHKWLGSRNWIYSPKAVGVLRAPRAIVKNIVEDLVVLPFVIIMSQTRVD